MKKLTHIGKNLNAYKVQFDDSLLDEIRESYRQDLSKMLKQPNNHYILEGGRNFKLNIGSQGGNYFLTTYQTHPLLWFSSNNDETFQIYKRFLDALNIEDDVKELVDHNEKILLYCGFLVIGDQAPNEAWHVDYLPGANAYTFITPLFELDENHGNLLYRDDQSNGNILFREKQSRSNKYSYKLGEGVIFGDHFNHTTEKYNCTNNLRILVSLQFGTDKMEHWDTLRKTIESQSYYLVRPCGHVNGTCQCTPQNSKL